MMKSSVFKYDFVILSEILSILKRRLLRSKPDFYVNKALIGALIASGFTRTSGDSDVQYFQPCPLGTFSNSSSYGTKGCTHVLQVNFEFLP